MATVSAETVDVPATPFATMPPALPSRIQQVFLAARRGSAAAQLEIETRAGRVVEIQDQIMLYVPAIIGVGRVHFVDQRRKVNAQQTFASLVQAPVGTDLVRWDEAQRLDISLRDLLDRPEAEAYFDALPETVNELTELTALRKDLEDHLYRTSQVTLLHSPVLDVYSHPAESEREFVMRLKQAAREQRDEEIDDLTKRYEKKLRMLADRVRRAELDLEKKQDEASARKREVFVTIGESVLGVLLGRRSSRIASSTMRRYRMSSSATAVVEDAEEKLEALQREVEELEAELREQVDDITARWDEALEKVEAFPVTPRRQDVEIELFALAWAPHWHITYQDQGGFTRTELVPAY
jgi:DNA repair exonuclease SbcCD ATPase subunit